MTAKMNRRRFFKRTAGATSAAVPMIIPALALGRTGRIAPSERIVVGCIVVGTMGFADMSALMSISQAQVVAVCDVKSTMRDRAKQAVDAHYDNADCEAYNDFRDLLARRDIDAVSMATLDCWHVVHALAAVRAGKDVYVEKPLGMSIHEIKVLRDASIATAACSSSAHSNARAGSSVTPARSPATGASEDCVPLRSACTPGLPKARA